MNYYMQLVDSLCYPKRLIGIAIPFFMFKGLYTCLTTKDQDSLFTWHNEGQFRFDMYRVNLYKTRLKHMLQMINRTGKQYPDWKKYVEPINTALEILAERADDKTLSEYNHIVAHIGTIETLKERFNYD